MINFYEFFDPFCELNTAAVPKGDCTPFKVQSAHRENTAITGKSSSGTVKVSDQF